LVVALLSPASVAGAATAGEIVKVGRVRQADLPSGWLEKTPDDDESAVDVDELMEELPECERVSGSLKGKSRRKAESPDFEKNDNEISNTVNAYKDGATAKQIMRVARGRTVRTCFALLFEKAMEAAAEDPDAPIKIRDVSAASGPLVVPAFGDDSSGVMFKVDVDAGFVIELYFSLVFVRVGKFVAIYSIESEDPKGGTPARDAAIRATVARMTRAGA